MYHLKEKIKANKKACIRRKDNVREVEFDFKNDDFLRQFFFKEIAFK